MRMMKLERMKWAKHVARMRRRIMHSGGKVRRKESLERPSRRWVDNFKIYLRRKR
jgi:hypothetical protein